MSINSTLRREGIEDIKPLSTLEINKIASNISDKICSAFPEHNINKSDLFIAIARLNMYTAKMPQDHSAAKYFYKNNSIYFSNDIDFNNISTLALHESLHFIQEVKSKSGKLIRMGLYNISKGNCGMAMNEAAVQLMASIANSSKVDFVKYYDLDIETESPDFYPLECALIKQMQYFTGSYALFHSTLYGDDIFKNTFITKSNEKIYKKIEYNFDLLFHYEDLLGIESAKLMELSDTDIDFKKINYINLRIKNIKKIITKITLETQELIMTSCFSSELELVRDLESLKTFQKRLYKFKDVLIYNDNYTFYNNFYCYMMSKLEEKRELIKKYGIINPLIPSENQLIPVPQTNFITQFRDLLSKLKILFENYSFLNKEN